MAMAKASYCAVLVKDGFSSEDCERYDIEPTNLIKVMPGDGILVFLLDHFLISFPVAVASDSSHLWLDW